MVGEGGEIGGEAEDAAGAGEVGGERVLRVLQEGLFDGGLDGVVEVPAVRMGFGEALQAVGQEALVDGVGDVVEVGFGPAGGAGAGGAVEGAGDDLRLELDGLADGAGHAGEGEVGVGVSAGAAGRLRQVGGGFGEQVGLGLVQRAAGGVAGELQAEVYQFLADDAVARAALCLFVVCLGSDGVQVS